MAKKTKLSKNYRKIKVSKLELARAKNILTKDGVLYKELIKQGKYSRKEIDKEVRKIIRGFKKRLYQRKLSEIYKAHQERVLIVDRKEQLRKEFKKLGVKDAQLEVFVDIADTNFQIYFDRLGDEDWTYNEKETLKMAINQTAIGWSNELGRMCLKQFVATYAGQRAIWLPSSAKKPSSEHIPLYGRYFIIGQGLMGVEFSKKDLIIDLGTVGLHAGQRYGCLCEMRLIDISSEDDLENTKIRRKYKRKVA